MNGSGTIIPSLIDKSKGPINGTVMDWETTDECNVLF